MLSWFKSPYHRGQSPWILCARLKNSGWVHCIGSSASLVPLDRLGTTKKLQVLATWQSSDDDCTHARFYKQGAIAAELVVSENEAGGLDVREFRSSAHPKTLLKGAKTAHEAVDRFFSTLEADLQGLETVVDKKGLELRHADGRIANADEFDELVIRYYAPVTAEESPASVALMAAIQSGDVEGVRKAIEDGASLEFLPDLLVSPLSISFDSRRPGDWLKVGKLLIDAGAPIDGYDWEDPPIFAAFAAMGKEPAIVESLKLFLSMGADLNLPARGLHAGSTLLHQAVLYNYPEVVRFLLTNGAKIDARNKDRMTPLRLAELQAKNDPPCDLSKEPADDPVNKRDLMPIEVFAMTLSGTPEQQIRRRALAVKLLREATK